MSDQSRYDFIVVGAGSAGCVLAHRLTSDSRTRVLLLEAGPAKRPTASVIPLAWSTLFKTDLDWDYQTQPNAGLDGRTVYVPRGKAPGGSSTINAMMYVRGNRADYDEWEALGNPGWSYDEVLPYFVRSEDNSRGASEFHGAGGPLSVSDLRQPNPLSKAFVEAAVQAGIPRNDDSNGAVQEGAGLVQVNQRREKRHSAADAYLRPVRGRNNLRVLTGAVVTRIEFDGRRAVGVRYLRDGREDSARCEREVLLCGGAFNSPQLLMRSGVGPADELRGLGIEIVLDLPGVGRNLQDHPAGKILVRSTKPVSLMGADSFGNLLRYFLFRRGPLTSNGAEAVAFVRTRPALEHPDIEIIFLPVLWLNEGLTQPTEHGFSLAAMLLKPRSRGRVRLRSADPLEPPLIESDHFSDAGGEDLRTTVEGLKIARRIVAAPALAAFDGGEIVPGSAAVSDEELAASVRAEAQTIYHPVGTCAMGSGEGAVVDARLRVRGLEGLRVVDASVMPTVPRGHTHASAVMIGEKAADLVREGQT